VIAQSAPFIDPEVSERSTKGFMRKLKIKRGDIEALRKVSPEEIIKAQNEYMGSDPNNLLAFRPLIDGVTILKHPLTAFRDGDLKNIDFMIGTNQDEAKLFTFLDPGINDIVKTAGENAVIGALGQSGIDMNKGKEIVNIYKNARKDKLSIDPKELLDAVITDSMFRVPTIRILEAQSKHQSNTFNYMFDFQCPMFEGAMGCPHAIDIPFVFHTLNATGIPNFIGEGPEIEKLSEKVMDGWISFAHTGNPNHQNLPEWPPYDVKKRTTMFLGKECRIVNNVFDKEREAWDGLLEI
jgi:para-nitrobenzyl esterase